ncbi:hypothetical protein TNCV_4147491 [Trichonephila clavipes]|nr:hypothetical protein TNCV_4147491 [Trichonephila clavipes]
MVRGSHPLRDLTSHSLSCLSLAIVITGVLVSSLEIELAFPFVPIYCPEDNPEQAQLGDFAHYNSSEPIPNNRDIWVNISIKDLTPISHCSQNSSMDLMQGLGLNPGEDMGACKCIVPLRHESTLNSRQAASPLVWLVEEKERTIRGGDGLRIFESQSSDKDEQETRFPSFQITPTCVYGKKKLSDGKTIGGKCRLIDKLAHYYGNAIRCNSTSVKEMRKAIWAVWGHSCSTDD